MFGRIGRWGLRIGNRFLAPLEKITVSLLDKPLKYPPVFIIGPPRAGTTLLYQLLVANYHFAYFSNLTARLFRAPVIALWLEEKLLPEYNSDAGYSSTYGQIQGIRAPHEAGEFWYRWFPRGDHVYVPPAVTDAAALRQLRCEVAGMSQVTQKPALFKNTYNSMRIAPISEALPEGCFLIMWRDPVDIAQSILSARVDVLGNKEEWWALPPKEIDEIRQHPYWEQVVEQVYYVYRQIEDDSRRFGTDRFYTMDYKRLCEETPDALSGVEGFLRERGVPLGASGMIPRQFTVSTGRRVDLDEFERIKRKVAELWLE